MVEVDPCFHHSSKKIMVDVDAEEINKMSEKDVYIDYSIVTDAKNFFDSVTVGDSQEFSGWKEAPINHGEWLDKINEWKHKYGEERHVKVTQLFMII